jgi:hypothetical protein
MQNLRRGHDDPRLDEPPGLRVAAGFAELAEAM